MPVNRTLKCQNVIVIILIAMALSSCQTAPEPTPLRPIAERPMTFAIIGDYGAVLQNNQPDPFELSVAKLVNQGFCPDFIINVGDNNYNELNQRTFQATVGNFYQDYGPESDGQHYAPRRCAQDIDGTQFFPVPGNCDVVGACTTAAAGDYDNLDAYAAYFDWANIDHALHPCESISPQIKHQYPHFSCPEPSGYTRLFYDFKIGEIHFFALNTYCPQAHENGGCYAQKIPQNPAAINALLADPTTNPCARQYLLQMLWMKSVASRSDSTWKLALFHHPPHSSGNHGSCLGTQFDYQAMGIDAVLAGHNHSYNRVSFKRNDSTQPEYVFITIGLGGASTSTDGCGHPVSGLGKVKSNILYEANHGAIKATANQSELTLSLYQVDDWETPVDSVVLKKTARGISTSYCPTGCATKDILNCKP